MLAGKIFVGLPIYTQIPVCRYWNSHTRNILLILRTVSFAACKNIRTVLQVVAALCKNIRMQWHAGTTWVVFNPLRRIELLLILKTDKFIIERIRTIFTFLTVGTVIPGAVFRRVIL